MKYSKPNFNIKKRLLLKLFFYGFFLVNNSVFARETILEKIGWSGGGSNAAAIIITGIFIVFAVPAIYYLRYLLRLKEEKREAEKTLLEKYSKEKDLTPTEKSMLVKLANFEPSVEPHIIFESVVMFEKTVHNYFEKMIRAGINENELLTDAELIGKIRRKLGFHRLASEHPLISSRNIEIGQRGGIYDADRDKLLIKNAVVTSNNDYFLTIEYNPDKEGVIIFPKNSYLRFVFTRQHDSVYGITFKIKRFTQGGKFELYHTLELKRNQLRRFVRVEVNGTLKVRLIRTLKEELSEFKRGDSVEARFRDISGGGLCFIVTKSFRAGDIVSLSFQLGGNSFAGIVGKIVKISLQEGKTENFYRHHVQFIKIENRDRERIVKYVFDKIRQLNQWR